LARVYRKTARQKYQTNEGYLGYRDLIWVRSATLNMLHTLQVFSIGSATFFA
jgi:hypothetical protein